MLPQDLFLPVQRQMIGEFAHDVQLPADCLRHCFFHCSSTARACCPGQSAATVARRPDRAGAGILQADLLGPSAMRGHTRNVRWFPPRSGADPAHNSRSAFPFSHIVHNALALQMPRQSLPAATRLVLPRSSGAGCRALVIIIALRRIFSFLLPHLPQDRKQRQLICRELLVFAISFGIEQLRIRVSTLLRSECSRSSCAIRSSTIYCRTFGSSEDVGIERQVQA